MIHYQQKKRAALVSMLRAWRTYGDRPFKVNRYGHHWGPLCDAEMYGWTTWIGDRCRLTAKGIEQVIPYGVRAQAMAEAVP